MAVAAPTSIGSASRGATASATMPMSTNTPVAAGEVVFFFAACSANKAMTGVEDSAGNVYSLLASNAGAPMPSVWACRLTNALPSGATITITYGQATSSLDVVAAATAARAGIAVDSTPNPANSAGTATVWQLTLNAGHAGDLTWAVCANNGSASDTPAISTTELFDVPGSGTLRLAVNYYIAPAGGSSLGGALVILSAFRACFVAVPEYTAPPPSTSVAMVV